MLTFRTLNKPAKSALRRGVRLVVCAVVALAAIAAQAVKAQSTEELDVLRVDVPLESQSFRNGELNISALITDNTYIDVEDFNLRAVEVEAYTERNGEVRLKVGRYVTPPVPLPGQDEIGLLRVEAPHKANNNWRLLIEDRVTIRSLTAVLEPRSDNLRDYRVRYEQRGYRFDHDPYFRNSWSYQTRLNNWPYSWLRSDYDYNRRAGHWLWLTDSRSRFHLNPSYGIHHRHTRICYDRFGRHLAFGGQFNRAPHINRYQTPGLSRNRSYLYERERYEGRRRATTRQRIEEPRSRHRDTARQRPNERPAGTVNRELPPANFDRSTRAAVPPRRPQRPPEELRSRSNSKSREPGKTPRESMRPGNRRGHE